MTKILSEMTRADWLTRRWINITPPGSPEMVFADAGEFPVEQRAVLLDILHAGRPEARDSTTVTGSSRAAGEDDEPVAGRP